MTMGDEAPVTALVLPVLLRPILSQVNKYLYLLHIHKKYILYNIITA